ECSTWPGRSAKGRQRRVLRVWYDNPNFATYHCARCGVAGFARDGGQATRVDLQRIARLRAEAARREQDHGARQLGKARWLWRTAAPIRGTPAEAYLRSRHITTSLPATIRFLSARKPGQLPAMITPFGIPDEPSPGE